MSNGVVNPTTLQPLFGPSDIPNCHRAPADVPGGPAKIVPTRRPSKILFAENLRKAVAEWRASEFPYAGASDTSRQLLLHWFGRDHEVPGPGGARLPFSYYFCQREAIETLIYLYEVRAIRSLAALTANFAGIDAERLALGVNPETDLWPRYAFKIATGAGKTKVMSLADRLELFPRASRK